MHCNTASYNAILLSEKVAYSIIPLFSILPFPVFPYLLWLSPLFIVIPPQHILSLPAQLHVYSLIGIHWMLVVTH